VPLHYAVEKGHLATVKALLDAGAEPSVSTANGETCLHLACKIGAVQLVPLFLSLIHIRTPDGMSPLYVASSHGHLDIVKLLMTSGSDVIGPENVGQSICIAIKHGHLTVASYLITTFDYSDDGNNILIEASERGYLGIVRVVVEAGASKTDVALYNAVHHGYHKMVTYLLKHQNVETINTELQYNTLMEASKRGWSEVFTTLYDRRFNERAGTLMASAIHAGHINVCRYLLEQQVSPNTTIIGSPLLLYTLVIERFDIAELLLQYGASYEAQTWDGQSAQTYIETSHNDNLKAMFEKYRRRTLTKRAQ
jgi:ankyrin repeat protein